MKLFFTRTITASLLLMLSMCFVLFAAIFGCGTTSADSQILNGGFCAAEQTSVPVNVNSDVDNHAISVQRFKVIVPFITKAVVLFLVLKFILLFYEKVLFKIIILVRYGPVTKKVFLPYLLGAHGG